MPSASTPPPPQGLAAWREALLRARLPLLSSEDEQARLLTPQISLRDVQSLVEQDPSLALDLLALAAREPRLREGLRSLQQALNVLGMQRIQALVRARQARPAVAHELASALSLQAMATSELAALFVRGWNRLHHGGDEDHRHWLTRLLGVVRWKLPWVHPALAQRIEARVAAGERRSVVERELLGCDMTELNACHLQDLGIDEASDLRHGFVLSTGQVAQAARLGWSEAAAPELPVPLARALHQPTTGSALAYALALELQTGWYSRRAQDWMAVASAHLGQPQDRVRHDLIQIALIAANNPRFHRGITATAARLLWPADPQPKPLPQRRPPPAPATTPPAGRPGGAPTEPVAHTTRVPAAPVPVQPEAAAPPRRTPAAPDFEQRCRQAAFSDLSSFMGEAITHLHQDMGLGRCALFLKQAGADVLVCYLAHGFETAVPTREIQLPLQPQGLLTRLMQHPSATLWIRPTQVAAARPRLPATLADWITDAGCLLGTVQVRSHAMGLWWADAGVDAEPINDIRLTQFGHMTQVFGAEFTRLLHQQRQRKATAAAGAGAGSQRQPT